MNLEVTPAAAASSRADRRRAWFALAGLAAISPWVVRNIAYSGNRGSIG